MNFSDLYDNLVTITTSDDLFNNSINDCVLELAFSYSNNKLFELLCSIDKRKEELNENQIARQLANFLSERAHLFADCEGAMAIDNPINICCLLIAGYVESIFKISRYQILYPSIEITDYQVSSTHLMDDSLALSQFILSDDKKNIIEIFPCLEFAINDCMLKHTCLFNGEIKLLNEHEQQRVIQHSQETEEYWEAICRKLDIETKGESLGATLHRLAQKLSKGGVHAIHGGQEYNAGEEATVGIQQFFEWSETLDSKTRANLFSRRLPDKTEPSFGDIWARLARPKSENFEDTRYCVEILSGYIENILNHKLNQDLFSIYPTHQNSIAHHEGIEYAREVVAQKRILLEKSMASKMLTKNWKYDVDDESSKLIKINFFKKILLSPDLSKFAEDELINCMHESSMFRMFVSIIDPTLIMAILKNWGSRIVNSFINKHEKLLFCLKLLDENDKISLLMLIGQARFKKIIHAPLHLKEVFQVLSNIVDTDALSKVFDNECFELLQGFIKIQKMEQDKITMGRSMFHHACINGYLDVVKYMTKVQMYIQNPSLNDMEVLGKIINLKRGCQPALCINLYLSSYFVNSKKNKQLLLNAADDGLESLELSNLFKLYTDSSLPDQAIRSEIKMVIEKRSLELTNIQNLLKESADAPLITDVLCYYANPDFGPDFSMLNSLIVSGMAISHQNSNGLTLKKYVSTMGYHQNDQKTVQRLIDYSYQRNEAYKNMLATQSMFSQSSIAAQTDLDKQEMTNDTSLAFS